MLQTFLCFLPALALATALLARRYPGERLLLAVGSATPARARHSNTRPSPRRGIAVAAVRGSGLMGRSLAVRPPPARLAAS